MFKTRLFNFVWKQVCSYYYCFFNKKTLEETIQSCHLIKFTMFILEFSSKWIWKHWFCPSSSVFMPRRHPIHFRLMRGSTQVAGSSFSSPALLRILFSQVVTSPYLIAVRELSSRATLLGGELCTLASCGLYSHAHHNILHLLVQYGGRAYGKCSCSLFPVICFQHQRQNHMMQIYILLDLQSVLK